MSYKLVPHEQLINKKIDEFLPTLRLGIDMGEYTGGIAMVTGNEILWAESYVDFHESTLEDRRRLRRGRRTRHSKRMRLARLRSWVLRQRLSSGSRLPDPYVVMRDARYHYHDAKNILIEKCKNGEATPEEFVKTLTLLFQKRGFSWEGSDLKEMDDEALEKELKRVRITADTAEEIRAEIAERRKAYEEGLYEGGKKGNIKELDKLLNEAVNRRRSPRTPEHRSIVVNELAEVIKGFCAKNNEDKTHQWIKQLSGLLNRFIRIPKFDNRVIAGCSWCGKNTPRRKKAEIRKKAYLAAVHNIRVRDGYCSRPLDPVNRTKFLDLWGQITSGEKKSFGRGKIEKMLKELNANTEMAGQLYDLLKGKNTIGRTNLCKQCLDWASQGGFLCNRHNQICKLTEMGEHEKLGSPTGYERYGAKNPCREQHYRRIIRKIEQVIFDRNGRPRYESVPSLITIEFPKPNTSQSDSCPHCHETLAIDLDRVRGKIKGISIEASEEGKTDVKCPNPDCGKYLKIKLKKVFFGGVKVITAGADEIAVRRTVEGGMRDKRRLLLLKETKSRCVYCYKLLNTTTMEDEHIVPRGRGGPDLIINRVASCRDCNAAKKDRTPWEWLGVKGEWKSFVERVSDLPMPRRKKEILTRQYREGESFPDNPSGLARGGALVRRMVRLIKEMLCKHGVPESQIATNYEKDKIVIQSIDGWMTSKLRNSWSIRQGGTFPLKDPKDLYNHAQDAVLIAACPPHTWRDRIFTESRIVNNRQVWGLAVSRLMPDWNKFFNTRSRPIVSMLGRAHVSWRRSLMNETLYAEPDRLDVPARVHKPLDEPRRNPNGTVQLREIVRVGQPEQLVQVAYFDPVLKQEKCRKVSLASGVKWTAVVFWIDGKGRFHISVKRPRTLRRFFGNRPIDPVVEQGSKILVIWEKFGSRELTYPPKCPKGFYRLKEAVPEGHIIVMPENSLTKDIAKKMGLSADDVENVEIRLNKGDLAKIFGAS